MTSSNLLPFKDLLISPLTGYTLSLNDKGAFFGVDRYEFNKNGQLDFRLNDRKKVFVNFELPKRDEDVGETDFTFDFLKENPAAELQLNDDEIPRHLSKELISWFPKAKENGGYMLDLGCGNKVHEAVCKKTGFQYIGLDYCDPKADILGDAHALPFKSGSFDFILSIAVLAHLRNPFVATQEVNRVLKPGGVFIGTVAFLEPFNGNSFYHMTHFGIYNLLKSAGLEVKVVAPSKEWDFLEAQISMGYVPRIPKIIAKAKALPLKMLHKLSWAFLNKFSSTAAARNSFAKLPRMLLTTGAFAFVAVKPKV